MRPYYEHAGITIYHGDCREVMSWISSQRFDVNFADALITDPPYGVNLGNHYGAQEKRKGRLRKLGYASYDDTPGNFAQIVVPALEHAVKICTRGLVFCSGQGLQLIPRYTALGGVFLPAGSGRSVWGFSNFAFAALYGVAPDLSKGCRPTGFSSSEISEPSEHPCPKPYGWITWAVLLASKIDELVFDPFCGSGTTLVAAKHLGRRAIGIELEERYCEIAAKRLAQEALPLVMDYSAPSPSASLLP